MLIVTLVFIIVGVLAFWIWGILGETLCPNVVGKPFNEAVKIVESHGFKHQVSYSYLKVYRKDKEDDESFFARLEIIDQRPSPGVKIKPWKKVITLYVTRRKKIK